MKGVVLTPDSVPSLAALSSSSSTDAGDNDVVTRVLFETPDKNSICASDASSTTSLPGSPHSSESLGTVVAPAPEQEAPQQEQESTSPINVPNTCHGAISSNDLANIFTMFQDATRSWPHGANSIASTTDVDSGAITTVTSNIGQSTSWERKVDSLDRECAALKDIIKADSVSMLNLKREIEALRLATSRIEHAKKLLRLELDVLKKERDVLTERETQHAETIRILKDEVNKLTRSQYESTMSQKEVDQLRLENELFASQIIENEAEIRQMRAILEERSRTENKNDGQCDASAEETHSDATVAGKDTSDDQVQPIEERVASLAERLATIERERQLEHFLLQIRRNREENGQNIAENMQEEGFEVSPDGDIIGVVPTHPREGNKENEKSDSSWSGLCCHLSSLSTEEE